MRSLPAQALFFLCMLETTTAYLVDPPTQALPGTIEDCSAWWVAEAGQSCNNIATANGMGIIELAYYNPSCKTAMETLVGNSYCIERRFGLPEPTSTTSSMVHSSSPSSDNGVATPSPIQKGMTSNCNKFYLVIAGDGCFDIATSNAISVEDFYTWNTAIGTNCAALWAQTYVCVGILGSGTSTPKPSSTPVPTSLKPTTTSSDNSIVTPTPIQPSIAPNCNGFYLVKAGDSCYDIATANSISLDQFYAWNPYVKTDCSRLWSGYNVCIRVVRSTASASSTFQTVGTTSTKPPSSTPTPTQPGMINNCKKFYKVQSGDGCWALAEANKISLDNFYLWNPAVKTDCSALWAQYYVCVGV